MRAVIILLLVLVACRREDVAESVRRPRPDVTTTTIAAPPVDLKEKNIEFEAPLQAPVITSCKTGLTLDANGFVSIEQATFTSRDKIHTSVWLKESPAKLVMSVRALGDGEKEVAVVNKPANFAKTMTLTLEPLKPGHYKLQTYWGGNVVCEKEIDVTSK